MKTLVRIFWVLAALVTGAWPLAFACSSTACSAFDWATEVPVVEVKHPDATCEAATANLTKLGGCGIELKTMNFQQACERANGEVDDNGNPIKALDTACIAAAESCQDFARCD